MSDGQPPFSSKTRVFVVEDQPKFLKLQLRLLSAQADLEIVGTALCAEAALEALAGARPDVVLSDLGLPGMSGIALTREIKALFPSVEVLVFTVFDDEEKVLEAVRAGASGYLLKGAPAERVAEAIREVRAGGSVIQPNLARRLLRHFQDASPAPSPDKPSSQVSPSLSSRELEILQLIAKGVSNSEAARLLGLSKATVRTHLEHIYAKLEVGNRVEAVTEGIRKGLISV